MKHDLGPQISQGNLSVSTMVQLLIHALLGQSLGLPRLGSMHKPSFVHQISKSSMRSRTVLST